MGKMRFGEQSDIIKQVIVPDDSRLVALEKGLDAMKSAPVEIIKPVTIFEEVPISLLESMVKKSMLKLRTDMIMDIAISDEKIQDLSDLCMGEFEKISFSMAQHTKVIDKQGNVLVNLRSHNKSQDKKRKLILKKILKPIKKDKLTYAALGLAALSLLLQFYGG